MKYLLDVSALIALGARNHQFHQRVAVWVKSSSPAILATCSITELGFVRVLSQASAYGVNVTQARTLLEQITNANRSRFTLIADMHGVSDLPNWVSLPKQMTDGHLCKLASANGAVLATLDKKIPGSFVIPE